MTAKPIVLATATAAVLLAGLALAQQHQYRQDAPRGAAPVRMHQAAPQHAHRAPQAGGVALQGDLEGVVAEALGLTADELQALKAEGASIAQIAEDRGVALADAEAAYLAARQELIDGLLADGTITELQATTMAERGAAAFEALATREGCAGGVQAGGEPLHQYQTDAPRGPQDARMGMRHAPRGPGARW